jgi:tetratricopeptide (TPR) repeat protein
MRYFMTCALILCFTQAVLSQDYLPFLMDSTDSKTVWMFIKQKKYKAAYEACSRMIAADSSNGRHYFNRAVANVYYSDTAGHTSYYYPAVLSDCLSGIDKGYETGEAFYLLYEQYYGIFPIKEPERYNRSKAALDRAVMLDPDNLKYRRARMDLARSYWRFNELTPDVTEYEQDCQLLSESHQKEYRLAGLKILSEIAEDFHHDTVTAIRYLSTAIATDPTEPFAYLFRGSLKDNVDDYRGAIADYSTFIRLEDKTPGLPSFSSVNAYRYRGRCFMMLDQYTKALTDLTASIRWCEGQRGKDLADDMWMELYADNMAESYRLRGLVYGLSGNSNNACRDFSKAMEYGSEDAKGLIRRHCQ